MTEFKELSALLGPLASARHPTVQPFGALHLARRAFHSVARKRNSRASQRGSD